MADPVTIGAAVGWGIKVSGWLISPIMSKLVSKGFSYIGSLSSNKLKKLESKVLQLKLMLEALQASPGGNRFEPWLKDLKSAFYEAEDILDTIDYHKIESHIMHQTDVKPGFSTKYVSSLFRRNKKQSVQIREDFKLPIELRRKLVKTLSKIEKLVNEGHKFLSLLNLPAAGDNKNSPNGTARSSSKRYHTTSAPPTVVFGRDEDLEKIRRMLHDTPANDEPRSTRTTRYSVIGLYGIAGSGKTTLAQYVSRKEREDGYFNLIMWVHVSQNFSVDAVFSEMLEIASGRKRDQLCNLDMLQRELEAELRGKRFFLVLDDVWYDKSVSEQQLDLLLSPFKAGEMGSKILVTTRTADAARALGADQNLMSISDMDKEEFFKMFMHYALDGATISDQALLREHQLIGREIAGKLGGSPLAARTVAGQLRRRLDIDFWRMSLNRDWLKDTMGALWWSYQQLEEHVRHCFAYCSMFPRRYELEQDKLVQLWVAEGFVETTNETEDMEDVGHDYFQVLLSTSFIQLKRKTSDNRHYFTIHDLLHDLAGRVAGSDCYRIEKGIGVQIPQDTRHLFVDSYNSEVFAQQILKLESLRTLIMPVFANKMAIEEFECMLKTLKKLRVVHVRLRNFLVMPDCFGKLKHLRDVYLFGTVFCSITLPPTFTKLYHLQKFSVPISSGLRFPCRNEVANLVNLRYIITYSGLNIPDIRRMTWLRTLSGFTVRKTRGYEIQQLEKLDNLHGMLYIDGLGNVKSKEEARQANLANKIHISSLSLDWKPVEKDGPMSRNIRSPALTEGATAEQTPVRQEDVIEALRPPSLVTKLFIRNYGGSAYPSWLSSGQQGTLRILQHLNFSGCNGTDAPPKFSELLFVCLRKLTISFCSWKSLPDNMERLTSLEELSIEKCENILSLPRLPPSLKKLTLAGCDRSLMKTCQRDGHPNWQNIAHISEKMIKE